MVRSHCLGPVVVALVLAGLAWGQAPSPQSTAVPPKTSSSRQPTITIEEPGQAPERCRLLKFWLLSDGSKAYVAQALTSNEMLTIVQTGPSTGAAGQQGHPFQAAAMRIYHWGSSKTAPEGAPQPPANVPPVVLQPSSPTVINPSTPAGTTQRPLFGQASTTGRTWPSAYVDTSGKMQNTSTTQVQYTTSASTPNITPTPSCVTCNQCTCSPCVAVQAGASTPASGAVSTPIKLATFPAPQIIQGPATTTPTTAALAGQLNASTDSNQGNTAAPPAQSSPARRPGFFARLFQGDDQKPGAPAQAGPASQLLPLARVTPVVTPAVTFPPPAAVEVRRPALPALPELAPTAAIPGPAATIAAATPSAMLPLAVVKPVLKPLLAARATVTKPLAPAPAAVTKPVTAAPATAVPAPRRLPLATVRPVVPAVAAANLKAPPTSANPVQLPLASAGTTDPLRYPGQYVKVPGHDNIGVPTPPLSPQVSALGTEASDIQVVHPRPPAAAQITPVGAVNPNPPANQKPAPTALGPTSSAAPIAPAGLPATLPAPGPIVAPRGRQSVLAAQAAAVQVSAEMKTPPAPATKPTAPGVQVNAREANAFSAPGNPQGNAWPAPYQMGPPPGYSPYAPAWPGQTIVQVAQPMMPPPGQPMALVPAMPYQGPACLMRQPPAPPTPHCPIPEGYANAFTQAGNPNPIPADMGHDARNDDNAFQAISCATLAVPPGPPCGVPVYPGRCCAGMAMAPFGPYGPLPYGMMPPGPMPYGVGPMPPGMPEGMVANPALAPVRATEQQLAELASEHEAAQARGANPIQTVAAQAPASVQGLPETASLPELMGVLSDSLYPSQREWAADRLTHYEWRVHPQVVESLLQAARDDPAPLVRAGCIRSLGRLKASTTFVAKTLQEIKETDKDARVRKEAEQVLKSFAPGSATASDRPAGRG